MISEEEVIRIAIQQSNKHAVENVIGEDFLIRFATALFSAKDKIHDIQYQIESPEERLENI